MSDTQQPRGFGGGPLPDMRATQQRYRGWFVGLGLAARRRKIR